MYIYISYKYINHSTALYFQHRKKPWHLFRGHRLQGAEATETRSGKAECTGPLLQMVAEFYGLWMFSTVYGRYNMI